MFRTRHSLEAILQAKADRTRPSGRDPSAFAVAIGLAAFVAVAALGLFLAAVLGR